MMVLPAREASTYVEDDHPSPRLLDPAVGWVRNIPLSTLVAYREKVSSIRDKWHPGMSPAEFCIGIPCGDASSPAP